MDKPARRNGFSPSGAATVLVLLLAGAVFSQQGDVQALNSRLVELHKGGDLDAAVPVAEEIVKLERKQAGSGRNLVNALENLAQLKIERMKRTTAQLRDSELTPAKTRTAIEVLWGDVADAEMHLREAVRLAATTGSAVEQQIDLRSNLAWLLYNYVPLKPTRDLGFDKTSRDKLEMQQRAVKTERFDEARALYSEAMRLAATAGPEADMATRFKYAEFETAMGNFEAALSTYERLLQDSDVRFGKTNKALLPLLDSYAKVLAATGQDDQVYEVLSRIVRISSKSAQYPKVLLDVTLRADKAFAPVNSAGVESDSRANKERAELAGRRRVATSAIGADAVSLSQAVSTLGREFYDSSTSRGVKVRQIIVRVEADEAGTVRKAEALTEDAGYGEAAETAVRGWKIRPVSVAGTARGVRGYVQVTVLSN